MERARTLVSAIGLVGSPLLLLGYWLTYPAYGELDGGDVLRKIAADPSLTRVADVFAFASVFLAVPATLAYLRVLRERSPRLAGIGAALSLVGWGALVGVLMTDVVAVELADQPALFDDVYTSPFVLALNALASGHVIGAVLFGVALVRTRLVARPWAIAVTLAPVIHVASNVAGLLWIDAATWVLTAAVGVLVVRLLLRPTTPA